MKTTEKRLLRAQALARRDALPEGERLSRSQTLSQQLVGLPEFKRARVIMAYMSIGAEFDTRFIMDAIHAQGAQLVLPRVDRVMRQLHLYAVNDLAQDLVPGVWGIREPNPQRCAGVDISQIDFILVPGAVFDSTRNRIGYGGGFYDRLLALPDRHAVTVSTVFREQMVPQVPLDDHDRPVDILITDDGVAR
jgi:5-formyltetrahydrofolate cyclo-ligase